MLAAITVKPRACHPGWVGHGNGEGDGGSRPQIFHSQVGCWSLPGARGPSGCGLWMCTCKVEINVLTFVLLAFH